VQQTAQGREHGQGQPLNATAVIQRLLHALLQPLLLSLLLPPLLPRLLLLLLLLLLLWLLLLQCSRKWVQESWQLLQQP
jgi:hypothetical protein